MDPVLHMLARTGLACLLAAAALHKLRDPAAFVAAVAAYRLTPRGLAALAAAAVTAAEVGSAALLAWPASGPAGALGAAALFALYAAAMGVNLARGRRHLDCGCVGPAARRAIGWGLVGRNLVLVAIALAACAPVAPRLLGWTDGLTVAGGLLAASLLWGALDGLLATAPAVAGARSVT